MTQEAAGSGPVITAEDLLAHTTWLRRLARSLVGDAAADDVVQETWETALKRPPDAGRPLRPWLAVVLRNVARMTWRSSSSRRRRESEATASAPDPIATPEDVVARAEAQHRMVELLLRLAEPYRSTLLLRFFEGLEPTEIARRLDVPAGTVRWRLKEGLDRLRAQLDEAHDGDRRKWIAMLAPIAKGIVMAKAGSKLVAAALLLLLLLGVGGGAWWITRSAGAPADGRGRPPAAATDPQGRTRRDATGAAGERQAPAFLAPDPLAPARRVAGKVTRNDAPVPGAEVRLSTPYGYLWGNDDLITTTDHNGQFDFGLQQPHRITVVASAPGMTSAGVTLNLANPTSTARHPPDAIELRLGGCELALAGRVTDAAGGPIAGARVSRYDDFQGVNLAGDTTSDADGRYQLCVAGGVFSINVVADGYGALWQMLTMHGTEARDFILTPEALVTGTVVREDGTPVVDALVTVSPDVRGREGGAERTTITDVAGRFQLDGALPGRHWIHAIAGEVGSERETMIQLAAGEARDVRLVLGARGTLRGVVRQTGEPIAGVGITAVGRSTGSKAGLSRADGTFELRLVPFGDLTFSAGQFEVVSPASFRLEPGGRAEVEIEVRPRAGLAGRVLRRGAPVPDAQVNLSSPDSFEVLRTDGEGRFQRRGLRPGRYTLLPMSAELGAGSGQVKIDLATESREDIVLTLDAAATISGRVVDEDGSPVVGASVEWTRGDGENARDAVSGPDGRYRAWALAGGGDYRAVVRARYNSTVILPPARPFPVVALRGPDAARDGVDLVVAIERRGVAGRVVDGGGAPIADVQVTVSEETDGQPHFSAWRKLPRAVTGVDGRFQVDGLPAGAYAVQARSTDGGEAVARRIEAGAADLALRIDRPGAIEGRVVGFRDTPYVMAWRVGIERSEASDATDQDGGFALRGLPSGRYTVLALAEGEAAQATCDVVPGRPTQIELRSRGTASVEGRVVDFLTGEPVAGVACSALVRGADDQPLNYWDGPRVPSDAQGRWRQAKAPAGAVAVSCDEESGVHSGGLITTTLAAGVTAEITVPVVNASQLRRAPSWFGATPDPLSFAPRLLGVVRGSPAAAAGLLVGDTITSVDGHDISTLSVRGVGQLITDRAPGSAAKVTLRRGNSDVTVTVTLTERPADASSAW